MSNVQTKIDYEYKVSGAARAADEMGKVGDGGKAAADGLGRAKFASEQTAEGLGSLIVKFVSLAAAIAAARRVVDVFTGSVSMAIDANEDMNKFLVVMGDNASIANISLTNLADTTGRNAFELRALSAGLQDMLVPMGVEREMASGLSTDFTRLAVDLSSFNNVPVDEIMNAMKSGLAGLSRPMRNFGVDLRMATVDQELLNMGIEGGYLAADTAQRSLAIYNLTVRQSADAQGDAARTSDEAANVLVRFRSSIQEARIEIGESFLPVIEELVPLIKEELAGALPMFKQIAERIAEDLQKYGPLFITIFGKMIDITAFLVEHMEKLETVSRMAAGPGVYLIAEAVDYFGDKSIETSNQVSWLSDSISNALTPFSAFSDEVETSLTYTGDLSEEIKILTNFTKDLTIVKRDEAMAHIETARAILIERAAIKGYSAEIKASLAKLDVYSSLVKDTFESAGDAAPVSASSGSGRGRGGEVDEEKANLAARLIQIEAFNASRLEMELQLKDTIRAKDQEHRAMEIEQARAQMEPLIAAAQQSMDIIFSGFTGGFDSVLGGFKNMLQGMAAEWAKSQVMKLLFSTGAKAATGGGFFLWP